MADFDIKRGDTAPPFVVTLRDRTTDPVNLTSTTSVQFLMRLATALSNTTPHVAGTMTKATQSGPTLGQVTYQWQDGDTNMAGDFAAEILVTWASGQEQTFPTVGFVSVKIHDDLEFHTGPNALSLADRGVAVAPVVVAGHGEISRPTSTTFGPRGLAATDAAEARAMLEIKCAASTAPILTSDELDHLVALADRGDGTSSYAINRAAAEGWRIKAGKAAGGFTFSADGTQVDKSMVMQACLEMARQFETSRVRTVTFRRVDQVEEVQA